jgi:hypothetical protein
MTAPAADAGKGAAAGGEDITSKRLSKPPLEKGVDVGNAAGTSQMPVKVNPLGRAIEKLAKPIDVGADPALMAARLEEQRIAMLREAQALDETRREFDLGQREYNMAHGFTFERQVR